MPKTFDLEVLTPRREVFKGTISSLVAPGALGYFGVWANHAPLVSVLGPGRIIYRDEQGKSHILESVADGILEVNHNQATLLADEIAES